MTTRNRARPALVDTSVAVPLLVAGHEDHAACLRATEGRPLGLSGHAAFESFSVLTRLPPPMRRSPGAVSRLLAENFPESRYLSPRGAASLLDSLTTGAIAGGAVYDALVGACAAEHGLALLTMDSRALSTYRAMGVEVVLVARRAPGGS